MNFKIEFAKQAKKDFSKLDQKTKERIVAVLHRIRIRPYAFVKKLVNLPYYSLRVGNYRLLLSIEKDKLYIYVIKVGHRKNIYD
tara:strand:+ start:1089 stop:1340 length:252 start_codon:yes stop_codon:yes gene_type:complete